LKIAILASGGLGLKCIQHLHKQIDIEFISTDSHSEGIIEYAETSKIPCFKGNPRKGKLYTFAKDYRLDVIFSINYLFIIEHDVISLAKYPINFHGSLLPKYRGRTPHVWSIINNEKITGVTAHIINEGCDTGDVLLQEIIPIEDEDTGNDILQKYVNIYPTMLEKVIQGLQHNNLNRIPQNNNEATYYDKRTPDDGEIDWEWQKERINNWVRAQSYPYPGAFTIFNGSKLIVDKTKFSNLGYNNTDANGMVIETSCDDITVKTQNGAIELTSIRNRNTIDLPKKGDILGK
jgi:methionyl-tRNA formyltransferase